MKKLFPLICRLALFSLLLPLTSTGQDFLKNSSISGSFQTDAAYYLNDSKMGINDSTLDGKYIRMNGFMEVNYTLGNFTAGMRFEAYLPPLIGYDMQYDGLGVPYWYARYKTDMIDITAGNFYEQFGNGMMFRTYQEWTLGYDNSLRGLRVKFMPINGITLKGIYGVQRNYWVPYKDNNRGIVKGFDADFYLNDMFPAISGSKVKLTLGGSFVSDYQKGKYTSFVENHKLYTLKLPENVATYGGRLNLNISGFNLYTEYAYKINDPSAMNNYIYKNGNALFTSMSYSTKGFGFSVMAKRIDNMSYKSDRKVTNNALDINYLPSVTTEHAYALAAMYPYATQPTGEFGFSATLTLKIKKNSKLGGKTGLNISANFSQVNDISKIAINDSTSIGQTGTLGYKSSFFKIGKDVFYQDANIEVTKKFGKKWKGIFAYYYITYNKDVVEGHLREYGTIYSHTGVVDLTFNMTKKLSLRGELQGLFTKQDKGNWLAGLLEFTISPKWFFSVQDQWNFGNPDASQQLHYYLISAGFIHNTTRLALSYGRQREGILCVGGVCRYVPASTGMTLTITSSF